MEERAFLNFSRERKGHFEFESFKEFLGVFECLGCPSYDLRRVLDIIKGARTLVFEDHHFSTINVGALGGFQI